MEADSSDEDGEEDISMSEEPGNDSGCTAVVALLRGKFLNLQLLSTQRLSGCLSRVSSENPGSTWPGRRYLSLLVQHYLGEENILCMEKI